MIIVNGAVQNVFSGDILTDGYITGKKSGVSAYLTAQASTTITEAGTYYPISGTFDNDPAFDFGLATVITPGIKYQGTKNQYYEIDWHAQIKGDSNGMNVTCAIAKNGVIDSSSVMGAFCKTLDEPYPSSCTCVVELEQNDEIQLIVTADGDGDVVTFENYHVTITEFYD